MKKMMQWILILMVVLMCLGLTACGGNTAKVEMAPYLSVSYTGYNGNGTAHVNFDFADFEHAIMSQWNGKDTLEKLGELTAVETTISYAADVSQGLRNGDTITVKIRFDEAKAKACGYHFIALEKKFTVEGLEEPILIDPFAEEIFGNGKIVSLAMEGIDPFVCLFLRNTAQLGDPIRQITYKVDNDWDLKNGDVITITATMDQRLQKQGYVLTRTETTITLEGFDRYVSAVADLNKDVLTSISNRAYQECVNGSHIDIIDETRTSMSSGGITPWGASIENIHVGDTALLVVNHEIDQEYSFLLVPVYKTITTDAWYDMDAGMSITRTWEDVVGYYKFSDLVVHTDDSVSYREDYIPVHGSFTSEDVAETLYLSRFSADYSLLEVPMP